MWTQIIDILKQNQRFILSSHLNPDCDALGSELALAIHLQQLGKDVAIFNSDPVIDEYLFLDPSTMIQRYADNQSQANAIINQTDVIIVLDASGGWERLGDVGLVLEQARKLSICIDHHPTDSVFTDTAVIDTQVIATGELIFDLITAMNGQFTPQIATALYAAILTDSGSFRFPKTSPKTHHIIAELITQGANPSDIHRRLYEQQPLARVQLKGHVLNTIQISDEGQVAYVSLDAKTLKAYQTSYTELNAFSNLAQEIGGVRVAILAVELPDGRTKISLRSDNTVPVNQVATELGGGGHHAAAGVTLPQALPQALSLILDKTRLLL
ncbi:MAG: bifunctional oligoribonuclease/PAP phosphatase NrnA [Chloroflexota bacterium]